MKNNKLDLVAKKLKTIITKFNKTQSIISDNTGQSNTNISYLLNGKYHKLSRNFDVDKVIEYIQSFGIELEVNEYENNTTKEFNEEEFKQLVPFLQDDFSDGKVNTINARDLWEYLGSKQEFSNWIKNKLSRLPQFKEGRDYLRFDKFIKYKEHNGGATLTEYHISIRMAQHFAATEYSEMGNRIRDYYFDIEEKWRNGETRKLSKTEILAQALLIAVEETKKLEKENSKLKDDNNKKDIIIEQEKEKFERIQPKLTAFDTFLLAKGTIDFKDFSKITYKVFKMGRNQLFHLCRELNILDNRNQPYQQYMNYFEVKMIDIMRNTDKEPQYKTKTYITYKGAYWLKNRISEFLNLSSDQTNLF